MRYTRNEIRALHSMLVYLAEEEEMSTIRSNNNAFIYPTQIFNILNQLGIITSTSDFPVGRIDFDSFVEIIQTSHSEDDDECHLRFLCIVNEYQLRCDSAGKYLLAQVFLDHLVCLSKEEENRRVDEVKNMLADDREKIIEAHERQQNEFSRSELLHHFYYFYFNPLGSHSQRQFSQLRMGRISCSFPLEIRAIYGRNATNSQAAAGLFP